MRQAIGLTGQYASVDDALTGTENLVMIGRLLDLSRRDARARASELLAWFDLTEAADRPARTYSGGMRRRLDLAASLVGRPSVIFLDEPTTGLDPSKRGDMWQVVRSLVADGATVLLTTQYLEEADALADEITVIDRGRVIAHDTPDGAQAGRRRPDADAAPDRPDRIDDAAAIIADVVCARPESPKAGVLACRCPATRSFPRPSRDWPRPASPLTELSLHLPSLDEAFLALTGKTTPTRADPDGGGGMTASPAPCTRHPPLSRSCATA